MAIAAEYMISELQREPRKVLRDIERGDIILKRRGAPSLRITIEGRNTQRDDAYAAMVRLVRSLVSQDGPRAGEAVVAAFPWARFLPPSARVTFMEDLAETLSATAELETAAPITQLLIEWKATAEIHADPDLLAKLSGPLEGPPHGGRVPRP